MLTLSNLWASQKYSEVTYHHIYGVTKYDGHMTLNVKCKGHVQNSKYDGHMTLNVNAMSRT